MSQIDLSCLTGSAAPHDSARHDGTPESLAAFAAEVRATVAALRPSVLAESAAVANQVQVQPGGQTFSTISAALASITDASQKKQYVCYIGPGIYPETVACKSWVFLQGDSSDSTFVTAPAVTDFNAKGTVLAASNSAIQNLAVTSTGNGWGCWTNAVSCVGADNFDIENCLLNALDPVGGANLVGVAVDYESGASGSVVYLAYTSVLTSVTAGSSQPLGLLAAMGSFVQLTECKLVAQGGSPGWGGASNGGSKLIADDSYVQGDGFSLNIPDYTSTCIANQCQLVGPVGNGVVVNP
jgi:hypothetical protein